MYRYFIFSAFIVFCKSTDTNPFKIHELPLQDSNPFNPFKIRELPIKGFQGIAGGINAFIASHPWMVSVQFRQDENEIFTHTCGGAIIDESWVLTAAHCNSFNSERPAKHIRVLAGSSKLSQMNVRIPVKKYYEHEQFDLAINGIPINDIMLLQLQKPLEFGNTIKKIDLDTEIGKNYTGELCTITGWGDTDANLRGKYPDRLQVLTMRVVTKEHCGTVWNISKAFWDKLICLQVKDKDSCKHDSGGPVVCSRKLVGTLTTGGLTCDGSTPSIHTRISAYLDWIKDKMNTKNDKNNKDIKQKEYERRRKGKPEK